MPYLARVKFAIRPGYNARGLSPMRAHRLLRWHFLSQFIASVVVSELARFKVGI